MLPDRFIDRSKQSHNGILAGPAVKKVRQGAQHGYKQDAPNHCFFIINITLLRICARERGYS